VNCRQTEHLLFECTLRPRTCSAGFVCLRVGSNIKRRYYDDYTERCVGA